MYPYLGPPISTILVRLILFMFISLAIDYVYTKYCQSNLIHKKGLSMLTVNEYFTGKVKSISFTNATSGESSVGVMVPGEYTFSTNKPEEMTVISGSLNVLLPSATDWQIFEAGQVFHVQGKAEFNVQVVEPTAYLCRYL